jgi:tRNA(Ile)-lysidine synthase
MSMPVDLISLVRRTIKAHRMMARGDRVVVAVSGGPDSVALLYLLWQLRYDLGVHLHVAHLDHGLRGGDSQRDARYTRRLARRLKLPITLERIQLSAGMVGSLEEQAREARYAFLERVAIEVKARRIATGHSADDQAETVLMRILRGAGSAGLAGIPPVRGKIVRPLIQVRRHQIEEYLRRHRLRPRRDATNRDLRYLRNRVRNELIPFLEKRYNPNMVETLNRIGRLEWEERTYFGEMCEDLLKSMAKKDSNGKIVLDLRSFADYFNIGGKFLIRELIRKTKGNLWRIGYQHVERVYLLARDGSIGARVHLPDEVVVERAAQSLIFRLGLPKPFCENIELPGEKEFSSLGLTLRTQLVSRTSIPWPPWGRDRFEAFVDWEHLRGPFVLRSRRRGDRFRPVGMTGTRKLSDYLTDRKIPRMQRDEIPLLVGREGIVWVIGHDIADPCKVTEKTRSVLWARCSLGTWHDLSAEGPDHPGTDPEPRKGPGGPDL